MNGGIFTLEMKFNLRYRQTNKRRRIYNDAPKAVADFNMPNDVLLMSMIDSSINITPCAQIDGFVSDRFAYKLILLPPHVIIVLYLFLYMYDDFHAFEDFRHDQLVLLLIEYK